MKHSKKNLGFSFVEVLLASVLFSVVAGLLLSGLLFSTESVAKSKQYIQATMLSRQGLEVVRSLVYDTDTEITPGTYGLSYSGGWRLVNTSDNIDSVYTRTVEISEYEPGVLHIRSIVVWNDMIRNQQSVQLETLITSYNN